MKLDLISKEWAELCVHTRCSAFGYENQIPYEHLEQFSKKPLPELEVNKIDHEAVPESTSFIQGVFNYINFSPVEAWFFCKYLEQDKIDYHLFFDGGSDENPDRNFVVWIPNHPHYEKSELGFNGK